MTVIAWDGETLAADKLSSRGHEAHTTTKIFSHAGAIFGCAGDAAYAEALREWFMGGALKENFPPSQTGAHEWHADLLVITPSRKIVVYNCSPHPVVYTDEYFAIGSGAEVALGAMAMGATSVEAVEIASEHITSCGRGVDALTLDE